MNNKAVFLFTILFIIFYLITPIFSVKCIAYDLDDFINDILSLYKNDLTNSQKETLNNKISMFINLVILDKNRFFELAQKIYELDNEKQLKIYKILRKYLDIEKLKLLFPSNLINNFLDANSEINDKSGSLVEINEIYENENNKNKTETNKNNEENKDNKTNANNEENKNNNNLNTNTNNKENKDNNSTNANNESSTNKDNQINKSENKKSDNDENKENKDKKDSQKEDESIEGIKIPHYPEIYKQYSENELESIFKDAVKSYYNGETDKSFTQFWICIVNNYNKDSSSYYLGLIYEKNKDYDSAITFYKNSIDLYLSKPSIDYKFISYIYKRIGISYNQKRLFEQAILYLLKAIEYYPLDGESYFQIGYSYYNLQNFEKSRQYFQKAYQLGYQKALEYLQKLGV